MARNAKPVCFIAMAFDREDTDALYEKQILPVLQRNHITPVIINRRQSNDDLNIQIIEQIEKADFCIVDLTYARPSVYFEAGYAQRSIPVIYSVRSDHFKCGQPDDLKVHFDLQMKPVIRWRDPQDISFSTNLESRIKKSLLKEWNYQKRIDDDLQEAIAQFENTPISTRLTQLRKAMISALRRQGCNISTWHSIKISHFGPKIADKNYVGTTAQELIKEGILNPCASISNQNNIAKFVTVQSYINIMKSELKNLAHAYSPNLLYNIFDGDLYKETNTIFIHHFILGLQPITADRIESVLASFMPVGKGKCYCIEREYHVYNISNTRKYNSTWHFLAGIKSESQLKEVIKYQLSNYYPKQD
jgi:hypothetical protein